MDKSPEQIKKFKNIIIALSVVIPLAVAALFGIQIKGIDTSFLPTVYASINGLTALVLISALVAIKQKKIQFHERLMKFAMILSVLFLLMYVAYHMTSESTKYLGDAKTFYYILLASHIILSVVVIPLVLFSYLRAWLGKFDAHKKLVKYAFPIWLYVAVTGVIVYVMISPYY